MTTETGKRSGGKAPGVARPALEMEWSFEDSGGGCTVWSCELPGVGSLHVGSDLAILSSFGVRDFLEAGGSKSPGGLIVAASLPQPGLETLIAAFLDGETARRAAADITVMASPAWLGWAAFPEWDLLAKIGRDGELLAVPMLEDGSMAVTAIEPDYCEFIGTPSQDFLDAVNGRFGTCFRVEDFEGR